ncbi:5'-nucleotidase domain-containing protein 4-like isoform X2 [Abrus precatorius]|uniref:5'-nucleotidase domain-containing protein 4-like isoform X2 n=1 Tax=Abrus precatorius TaxID=3816 RepID=A0A8B8JF33_ABRPR|nr:5'-nucleotidase domain-containing protein 4-like isoform X2 [Abrus precatorius]XP_027330030.1 5'-nucleotidase domain-containing protein 4-like isoform X2 [Abrus precatorius]XP_027330031.1 5'-nucleotidase domain-containing protein 4-like isoform X2 [Abrus precatorius]
MPIPRRFVSFPLPNSTPLLPLPSSSRVPFASGIFSFLASSRFVSAGANQLLAQFSMDGTCGIGAHDQTTMDFPGSDSAKGQAWSSSPDFGPKTDIGKQIFCNRPLNMKSIVAVGFDMDYTLAQYIPETFESLAYQHTVEKLVYDLKYPSELLNWSFNSNYMVRGLVLDKKRGNILKMDRHKYVKVAYHGFQELSKEDKVETYANTLVYDSFDGPDYALIDTLFSLAEAYLFAQLVDFKDKNPGKIPEHVDYASLYKDVRDAVDLCHRDGTLKQKVAINPKRYINEDTSIVPMLKMLRDSGRATFLVTNSLWDYTNTVMNFLCGSDGANESTKFDWLKYFDIVITGSAKPSFFLEGNRANLFEVEAESGMLLNTDNGSPMPQVGNVSARILTEVNDRARKVFQGGSVGHLHNLLSIESSSQVLYVGDHIYGDILRSKKLLGWRTMLVIPELEKEVKLLWESRDARKELQFLRTERDRIEDEMHYLNESLRLKNPDDDTKQKLNSKLDKLKLERERVRLSHQEAQRKLHHKFHEPWGQLMKTGYQNSRFAHQVERFACLYTSQVSNLALFSADKYYRPREDFMQHEFGIFEI